MGAAVKSSFPWENSLFRAYSMESRSADTIKQSMPSVRSEPPRQSLFRVLSQKSVWGELWLSMKRVHKDKRARRRLGFLSLVIGLVLLLVVALVVYLMILIGTGSILFVPFVIPLLWWIRRSAKKEFVPMSIAPQSSAL